MRVADLFAGCGGFSAGFQSKGMEIVLAAENWEPACSNYEENFDHNVDRIDLSNLLDAVVAVKRARPDIVVGGPPCQEFSAAGLRRESKQAHLTIVFSEIVRAVRPLWFVMENVPEAQNSAAWKVGRSLLKEIGYGITEVNLNAAYYGVPQLRKRFFAIGRLNAEDHLLENGLFNCSSMKPLTVREFLGEEFGIDYYYRHPRMWGRRAIFSIDEPSPTVRSTNRPVAPGYKGHPLDPAPASEVRALTPKERARVQTFSKGFRFEGFQSDLDAMIANAVPVRLAAVLAALIDAYEKEPEMKSADEGFRRWLAESMRYTPRVAGNVVSRYRRVVRLLGEDVCKKKRPIDTIHRLEGAPEFQEMSSSVRSQLKRAITLRAEYRKSG